MKIISKYKDYYDYLQGIYGVDEKLVLDRRESDHPMYLSNGIVRFMIGNCLVDVLNIDGVFYAGDKDMIKLGGRPNVDAETKEITSYTVEYKNGYGNIQRSVMTVRPYGGKTQRTDHLEYGIYMVNQKSKYDDKVCPYPRLDQYNVQKVMSPEALWLEMSNWFSQEITRKEATVPVGDDNVRILSAGFDLRTSFRH